MLWHPPSARALRRFAVATAAAGTATTVAAAARGAYGLLIRGALTVDLGRGRNVRTLGPFSVDVAAPPEVVFDVIAEPYLARRPRALGHKLDVLERGTDMVLAAHHTPVGHGRVTTTLETVRFSRPDRIDFRLVRGPVPHVSETFWLRRSDEGTRLTYDGELGTDLGAAGAWWGSLVAQRWEDTVRAAFADVKTEAERRTRATPA
jgi:hypothetical protein